LLGKNFPFIAQLVGSSLINSLYVCVYGSRIFSLFFDLMAKSSGVHRFAFDSGARGFSEGARSELEEFEFVWRSSLA